MAFFNLFGRTRINTRAYQRLPTAWPIRCEPQTEANGRHLTSTGDVSAGGVAVTVPEKIPVGTKIRLEICVSPIGRSIRAIGLVVRCAPTAGSRFALGIRYIEIDPQDRIALNQAIEAHYRPQRYGRPWWRALFCAAWVLALCPDAWGYQPVLTHKPAGLSEEEFKKLSRTSEESETLFEFFKRRTQIGVGFDEVYNDNILLVDNAKRDDYITTLEGLLLFVDPRGAVLYGSRYEVNAYRYHKSDANAVDHDFLAFLDYDPGGRVQWHLDYLLLVNNGLTFGSSGTDILRRGTDFQRSVEHAWLAKLRYALNKTNALVPRLEYSLFDDQAQADATTDRKRFRGGLDLDHDLTYTWTLYGGYTFDDVFIPGSKLKSMTAHGGRVGARHEVTELTKLDANVEVQRAKFNDEKQYTSVGFTGTLSHMLGPRTTLTLGYSDLQAPSFGEGRNRYRTQAPSLAIKYELTPLILLTARARHEKRTTGASDLSRGSELQAESHKAYYLDAGLKWQFREQAHLTFGYTYSRSKSRDHTNHVLALGAEATF